MSRKIEFNTGRAYTAEGQRIVAKQLTDGSVLFADLSRGIPGHIAAPTFDGVIDSDYALRRFVMSRYDRNEYKGDQAASEFYQEASR